jgi:hypothetical protein
MKKNLLPGYKLLFRFTIVFVATTIAGILLLSFAADRFNDELFKQLGITAKDADRNILYSALDGHFHYSGVKAANRFATGDRVKAVQELAVYAKQYTKSAAFKAEYEKLKDRKKPPEPVPAKTVEEIKAAERQRLEQQIKQQEINAKSENEKLRNSVQYALPRLQKELSELDNPDNKVIKQRTDQAQKSYEAGKKRYDEAMLKLEADYPSNPEYFIRKRLQEILAITADVDYNAELREDKTLKKFVNPDYEKKPAEWKLAFRAGKETTDAVRSQAEKWIKEIK